MLPILLSILAITSDAWLEDFRQLQHEMATHYANLDSAIDDRRMDLPALRRRTEEALRKAKSDQEARQALDAFMRAFGDGHVSINWFPQTPTSPAETPKTLCERLRYRTREDTSGVDFSQLSEFTPITDDDTKAVAGAFFSSRQTFTRISASRPRRSSAWRTMHPAMTIANCACSAKCRISSPRHWSGASSRSAVRARTLCSST